MTGGSNYTLDLFGPSPGEEKRLFFDFNAEYKKLIENIVKTCEEFSHISDTRRIAVSYANVGDGKYGVQAKIYPLRFEGGASEKISRGHKFRIPQLIHDGADILYIVTFCVPRFVNLGKYDKLETIIHELYHISPRFNGDIRRLSAGGKAAHGSSKKNYDSFMKKIMLKYCESGSRGIIPKFLDYDYQKLKRVYGEIHFKRIKPPAIAVEKLS